MSEFSPREIVSELSRFIVGQDDAKRAVALALRNRWRRSRLSEPLRSEITPKNILMIGPTGVGKTEISRRLAKLANAPFLKVEATRFTEVGYVGRDVDQIVRDLLENAITIVRGQRRETVRVRAEKAAEDRIIKALASAGVEGTREEYRAGRFDDAHIKIETEDTSSPLQAMEIPGQPGMGMGVLNVNDLLGKAFGGRKRTLRTSVADARKPLIDEESDKLLDSDAIVRDAIYVTENDGIVFIDEIDKVARPDRTGADVSREGVQRDLLPMIEGTTVSTRHGSVSTDHILFIASGAFHVAAPSDLLPELQGRLPIRVELLPLSEEDFQRILTEPESSLIQQYAALIGADGVTLSFDDGAIKAIAAIAARVNEGVENIGARRLHTVMEKLLQDISFRAPDMPGKTIVINADYVQERLGDLAADTDVSRYIL